MSGKYSWNFRKDEYGWSFPCESIEECIDEAKASGYVSPIYIGDVVKPDLYCPTGAEDDILEGIADQTLCDVDFPDAAVDVLRDRLNTLVDEWIKEFNIGSDCFEVENIREVRFINNF